MHAHPFKRRALAALPAASAFLVAVAMVLAAELSGEREIIFPEAAAIAAGALLSPRLAWRADKPRILFSIGVCASAGVLIVQWANVPLGWQLALAFAVGQAVFLFSGTTFAPLISAVALPVLLGTRSLVYPLSAIALTALVLLLRTALERAGLRAKEPFRPLAPRGETFAFAAVRILFAGVLCLAAVDAGARFIVCPPLLVAFTEFSRPGSRPMAHPLRAVLLLAACAAAGSLCRLLLCVAAGLPLTLAAAAAALSVGALFALSRTILPPAAALALLAMLIPAEELALYPFAISAGAALFAAFSLLLPGVPSTRRAFMRERLSAVCPGRETRQGVPAREGR